MSRPWRAARSCCAPGRSGLSENCDVPLLAAQDVDGVFRVSLSAAELAAYRQRFPAHLDADSFSLNV